MPNILEAGRMTEVCYLSKIEPRTIERRLEGDWNRATLDLTVLLIEINASKVMSHNN
jgi:hypothetical protein